MIWSKFLNSGQVCVAPDYILVHESIKEAFLNKAVEEIKKHDYSIDKGNYVQIINDRNFQRLTKMIDKNKVYHGGDYNETNRYIEPTIMHNITLEDNVMQEEIFGPILPVITYKTLDEAIAFVKNFGKPLSSYFYSNNTAVKKQLLSQLSFGGGCINESSMHFSNDNLPFGGVGNSGFGSYHGKFGFDTFSHTKGILDKTTLFEFNLKYYNYTASKMKVLKTFFFSKLKLS
jgi:aldehyde dehydrogenase (NAD+)